MIVSRSISAGIPQFVFVKKVYLMDYFKSRKARSRLFNVHIEFTSISLSKFNEAHKLDIRQKSLTLKRLESFWLYLDISGVKNAKIHTFIEVTQRYGYRV
jgi:hypothetical protein